MNVSRVWAMPNHRTFDIKPIKELISRYIQAGLWVDPFANESKLARITNDINPLYSTDYHLEAGEFMAMFGDGSVDGVLYDPPYSPRQVAECYKNIGLEVTMETTQSSFRTKHIDQIARITRTGGTVISFGWNSSGIGKTRGFEIIEILLVPHGGSHNDTIVTVERKISSGRQLDLFDSRPE